MAERYGRGAWNSAAVGAELAFTPMDVKVQSHRQTEHPTASTLGEPAPSQLMLQGGVAWAHALPEPQRDYKTESADSMLAEIQRMSASERMDAITSGEGLMEAYPGYVPAHDCMNSAARH